MKFLDFDGLKFLSSIIIKRIKEMADALSSAISGLGEDLQNLTGLVSDAVNALDEGKADVPIRRSFVLEASGWKQDDTSKAYPYRYTFALSGAAADTRVNAYISEASEETTSACGLRRLTETEEGCVIFRSKALPDGVISGEMYIADK